MCFVIYTTNTFSILSDLRLKIPQTINVQKSVLRARDNLIINLQELLL